MEKQILVALDFNLSTPTALHFLRRFSRAAGSDGTLHTLSKYIIEVSMLEYSMLKYAPSMIAAAAVYITRRMTNTTPYWVRLLVGCECPVMCMPHRYSYLNLFVVLSVHCVAAYAQACTNFCTFRPQNSTLQFYTGYSFDDIWSCVKELNEFVKQQKNSRHKSIYTKYAGAAMMNVAELPCWDGNL
jgi:hypothetical protein